ncbi:MAG: hypothetical protein JNK29_09785 [Anaerolineales bacterium]|nr:hypothetical protein [Anaerolineales bacterium]
MSDNPAPRDAGNWARPVDKLDLSGVQAGGMRLNVAGRHLTGPIRGFGQMWQKTYWVRLSGAPATPQEVITVWKAEFPSFWPKGNRFYGPLTGIRPGEVAVLNLAGPGGVTAPGETPVIATGIMVIYADDVSFSFMTPEGHILAGLITFSAFAEDGATVAQVQALIRTMDPLYELSFRLGVGHRTEDDFWQATLRNLAARFNVAGQAQMRSALVDPRLQWSEAKNVWHNAAIRTAFVLPGEILKRLLGRS